MNLKLQEVANFGMFFLVMQTIHFIHVCVQEKQGHAFLHRVYKLLQRVIELDRHSKLA